jgi:hypothetical protein
MACTDKMWDLLKEFSLGNLKGDDLELILSHIETCTSCSDDLDVLASLTTVAARKGESLLEMEWEETRKKTTGSFFQDFLRKLRILYTPVPLPVKVLVPVAATVIVFIALGTFSYRQSEFGSMADLSPAPYVYSSLRIGSAEREELFESAMRDYLEGDYDEASRALSLLVDDQEYDEKIGFYLGVSLLLSGEMDEAVLHFQRTSGSDNTQLRHKSLWYLAQAHLHKGDLAGARSRLESLAEEEGEMSERAREQLVQIMEVERE